MVRIKDNESKKGKGLSKKKILLVSLLGVVVIGLIVLLCFIVPSKKKSETKKEAKTIDEVVEDMSDDEKVVLGLDKTEEEKRQEEIDSMLEEKTTTDLYKGYEQLTEEEKEKIDAIPRKEEVPIDEIDNIIEDQDDTPIPSSYDLRDYIDIKVENQDQFGVCWIFASLNALETNLALKENKSYDFSEMHVDYITSDLLYGGRQIHDGGNWAEFINYFRVSGPVTEEKTGYGDATEDIYRSYVDMDSDITITKTVSFPSIDKGDYRPTSAEDTLKIRDAIKRHIMTNGSVYASIQAQNRVNQYTVWGFPDHAITLIGWDDNYSKNNFDSYDEEGNIVYPKNDGAYIALNSWGKEWGEEGYFYISYEDLFVEQNVSGVVSTSMDSAYKISDIKSDIIRKYIRDNYRFDLILIDGEEYITDMILDQVISLDLSNMNIGNEDLEDIALFSKIYSLDLSNNHITDISKLPNLSRLNRIILEENQISDASSLTRYTELTDLDLSFNNLTSVDFIKDNFPELRSLYLDNNYIKDVSSLKDKEFTFLSLNGNYGVKGYEYLDSYYLNLSNCGIKELKDLSGNSKINDLDLSHNPDIVINDGFLPKQLYSLYLSYDNLTNIEFLRNCTNLYILHVDNNDIKSLSGLVGGIRSINIDFSNNPIENIDSLNGYEMVSIVYSNTKNVNLDIFDNVTNIFQLDLSNDSIKDLGHLNIKSDNFLIIDLSKNKGISNIKHLNDIDGLSGLVLDDCGITDLSEVSTLSNIVNLSLNSNDIGNVDPLNSMDNLEGLSIANNHNLSGKLSGKIGALNISNTNIKNLSIIKDLKNLEFLDISNSGISDIADILDLFSNSDRGVSVTVSDDDTEYWISMEDYGEVKSSSKVYFYGIDYVDIYLNGSDFKSYVGDRWYLRHEIMRLLSSSFYIDNGTIDKKVTKITYFDDNKPLTLKKDYTYSFRIYR